jgi:very-short-patch-repair endonuclease
VERVDEITSRQLGLITRVQALGAGLTSKAVTHRLRRGVWSQRRPGLYAVTGVPRSWEQEVLGTVLLAGDLAWASHATSACFWRYPGFGSDARLEITVPLEKRVRQHGVTVHRSGLIDERDLRVVRGVPCMSPARTIVDLSSRLTADRLGRVVDDGLRRGLLTVGGLDHEVRRFSTIAPGRSPKTLEAVLVDRVPGYHGTKSHLEQDVFDAIVRGGLPAPVRQHKVVVNGDPYYIDMAYPEQLVAIEADGFDFHRGRAVFDSDRARQNDLVNLGWLVLRFTSTFSDDRIVADVRRALFGRSLTL